MGETSVLLSEYIKVGRKMTNNIKGIIVPPCGRLGFQPAALIIYIGQYVDVVAKPGPSYGAGWHLLGWLIICVKVMIKIFHPETI